MAVDRLNEKLDALLSKESSGWMEEARFRADNASWLKKSQAVALCVLKTLREKGMSQKELAEKMGVSPQHINKIVKGKENLTLETIARLGAALAIDLFAVVAKSPVQTTGKQEILSFNEVYEGESGPVFQMVYDEQKSQYDSYKTAG